MCQNVHIQISISLLELSLGPISHSLKPLLWGPHLVCGSW